MRRTLLLLLAISVFYIKLEANECGCCETISLGKTGGAIQPSTLKFKWSQGEAETNKIDLLFVFDASARTWLEEGGWTEVSFANQVIQDMNCSIALTGLDAYFSFRTAGQYDLETDLSEWSLLKLCSYASGATKKSSLEQYFLPMRAYRDEIAADIVVVLTAPQDKTYYGISVEFTTDYLSSSEILSMANFAYSAVDIRSTFDRYTVLHEVGHIFGAGHSNKQKSSPGPLLFTYSAGYDYSINGREFTTVMGYMNRGSDGNYTNTRLPFFSSPDFVHNSVPVGTKSQNDNTRTLRETYPIVANFRVKTYLPEYSPSAGNTNYHNPNFDDISLIVLPASGKAIENGDMVMLRQFGNVEFSVHAECWTGEKAMVKAKGLPTGLKYSSKTGKISGCPKKTGLFTVKLTAKVKGMAEIERTFTISVSPLSDAIVGLYAGIISKDASGDTLATATLYKTGRVIIKFNHEGRNRTFSCYGFTSIENNRWCAMPSTKINKATHSLNANFDVVERAISIEGYTGKLLQNPWGRKDIAAPIFKKALQRSFGDFTVRLYGKGKAKLIVSVDGKKTSSVFQLVAGTPEDGYKGGTWSLPVVFPSKKNFPGWTGWLVVYLTTDESNYVIGALVEMEKNL